MNNRISNKERNLLKGAIRRVFSRSELRRAVVEASLIQYSDPKRPRVTKWSRCSSCKLPTAAYQIQVDHIKPLIPIDKTIYDLSWDELINRLWCDIVDLQPLCLVCHKIKSKAEAKQRAAARKERKKNV